MNLLALLLNKKRLSVLLMLCWFGVAAQNVKNYTLADGLPGNSIKCLFKDSKGLMWIATETGLCTFNGNEFKIIGKDQGLNYNLIWAITEDDKKNTWFSLYGNGIAKYDGKKFVYYTTKDGLINNDVRSLHFSKKQHCLVIGTEDGLSVFKNGKFKNFSLSNGSKKAKHQVNFISSYKNELFFSESYGAIYRLKINPHQFEKTTIQRIKNPNNQNYSGLIFQNNFFGRNLNGEFEIQALNGSQKRNYGKCYNVWDLTVTNNNTIYAATWDGNSPNGALLKYENRTVTDISQSLNLPTSKFWDLYYDNFSKQLWVGTIDQGIFVIDLDKKVQFEKINFGIVNPEINDLHLDKMQNLWICGNNFILKNEKNGKTKIIRSSDILNFIQKRTPAKNQFEFKNLNFFIENQKTVVFQTIKEDVFGNIWTLTNFGLFCFNQNLQIKSHIFKHETTGAFDFISPSILFLSHAYTHSYLVKLNNLNASNTVLYKGKKIRLDPTKIIKSNNKLWIASWTKGLYLYENDRLTSINALGCFNENNVSDIIAEKNQQLVIGTVNGKVYFSKWTNKKLVHQKILNPEKEIIGNSIFFIRKFNDFYLIGTNKGINIIKDFKLYKFINNDENLPQTTYTDACVDYTNKKLYISTYKGVLSVDLNKIVQPQKLNSPIQIDQIKVNGKLVPNSKKLDLNYYQNSIEIQFGSNNLYNSKKNYFTYKIVGLTTNWSEWSTETNLKLFHLKSGEFQLIIKGKNIGTSENFHPFYFHITLHPPFWKTWWFIGLSILIIITLVYSYLKQKISKIKNKAKLEKRIAETKLQALQSQMNPHFVFNAMNSIQNFVIDNQTDEALSYIGEFSKLIRQTLNFSSRTTIRLEEEIEFLQRYIALENLRRKNKVTVQITTADEIDLNELEIPPMLLQPLIENVFIHAFDQHTFNPTLTVDFYLKVDTLICRISDNGKGIQPNNLAAINSKGIKLVDERIRLLSNAAEQMIQFEAHPTNGTSIIITIPLR
jgi:ligand-binding sensor domain-containing protein